MNFNLSELEIIERLLQNRLNADYDPEVAELHEKVKKRIKDINYSIQRAVEWAGV